ncbi:MAG: zinc-ribbon domain-containing protein [Candidatus Micrarchaeota archaeon]|nr:zinc-ribbon domain-containing protein [Candidatus Micrarchaeota archaeon]
MQAQVHKKEKSPVVFCPRCHAQNLASQSRCGKCGFVFPVKDAYKGEKKGVMPGRPAAAPASTSTANPMGMGAPPGALEAGGESRADGAGEPSKPTRPKSIPEKGVSEGLLSSRGQWVNCPRCGADLKPDAKRCIRCGYKPN